MLFASADWIPRPVATGQICARWRHAHRLHAPLQRWPMPHEPTLSPSAGLADVLQPGCDGFDQVGCLDGRGHGVWRGTAGTRRIVPVLSYATDLGFFAEQADPTSVEMLGNFPQALVHAAPSSTTGTPARVDDARSLDSGSNDALTSPQLQAMHRAAPAQRRKRGGTLLDSRSDASAAPWPCPPKQAVARARTQAQRKYSAHQLVARAMPMQLSRRETKGPRLETSRLCRALALAGKALPGAQIRRSPLLPSLSATRRKHRSRVPPVLRGAECASRQVRQLHN